MKKSIITMCLAGICTAFADPYTLVDGTLTVTKDGATLGTYTQGEQEVHFFGSGTMALEFAYVPGANDEGGAVLSGFSADIGTMLIFR